MFITRTILLHLVLLIVADCHLVGDKSQISQLKKLCDYAYKCFHDAVIICGKSVNEARTFLDLCDMNEFSCEHNMVFRHVKEEEGVCPNPKDLILTTS